MMPAHHTLSLTWACSSCWRSNTSESTVAEWVATSRSTSRSMTTADVGMHRLWLVYTWLQACMVDRHTQGVVKLTLDTHEREGETVGKD